MKTILPLLLILILFNCNNSSSNTNQDIGLNDYNYRDGYESGYLEVPENRMENNGKTIKLAYVVLKANNPDSKKDPIIYLQGGPGGSTLFMSAFWEGHPLRNDRDIILMDQRGTGLSNAVCSDFGDKMLDILAQDLSPQEEEKQMLELTQLCKVEANEAGIDFSAYNSRENAADHEDLRKHLGYKKWNLFGGSYGSRLALTIMRDFPNSVNTSTIFGVFAPNANLYTNLISNFKRSLFGVFNECENSIDCNNRYPNIKNEFFEVFKNLVKTPYTFDYNGSPFTVNAQDMLLFVHQMLYARTTMGQIPAFVKALKSGNNTIITQALQPTSNVSNLINFAMYMSVNAYDELPFSDTKSFKNDLKLNEEFNNIAPAYFASDTKTLEQWHPHRAKAYENEPVVSDIPTLIINGNFDPVTPPANAIQAKESLSNSYYAEFEIEGHSIFIPCFFSIAQQFLDNPNQSPDMSCSEEKSQIQWN